MTAKADKTPTDRPRIGASPDLLEIGMAEGAAMSERDGKLKRLLEAVDKVLFSRHGAPPTETYFGCDCADCNTLQQARAAFGKED